MVVGPERNLQRYTAAATTAKSTMSVKSRRNMASLQQRRVRGPNVWGKVRSTAVDHARTMREAVDSPEGDLLYDGQSLVPSASGGYAPGRLAV
jgi:hypothetical protein